MIEEQFYVTVDIPKRVDMKSRKFEHAFIDAVCSSSESGTQNHDWRFAYARYSSYHEAAECEARLKEMIKLL